MGMEDLLPAEPPAGTALPMKATPQCHYSGGAVPLEALGGSLV